MDAVQANSRHEDAKSATVECHGVSDVTNVCADAVEKTKTAPATHIRLSPS